MKNQKNTIVLPEGCSTEELERELSSAMACVLANLDSIPHPDVVAAPLVYMYNILHPNTIYKY